jgi:hypothetical protein
MGSIALYPFGEGILSLFFENSVEPADAGYTPLEKPSLFSLYPAKVVKKDETLGGYFVQLQGGWEAFLPFGHSLRAKVGEKITVEIIREALEGKPPRVGEKFFLPLGGCTASLDQKGRVNFVSPAEGGEAQELLKVARQRGWRLKVWDAKRCLKGLRFFETYLRLAALGEPFKWFHFYTQTLLSETPLKLYTESGEFVKRYNRFLELFGITSAESSPLTLERLIRRFPPSLWEPFFKERVPFDGGYLLIYENEGLIFVDVNGNLSHYLLNLKALELLTKLLPLRKWGGLIAVDFVDIPNKALKERLKEEIKKRLTPFECKALGFTNGGLFEILCPKRVPPLLKLLRVHSTFCDCAVKSDYLLFLEIAESLKDFTSQEVEVVLHPHRGGMERLFCLLSGVKIKVKWDPAVGINRFKLLVGNG